MISDLTGKISSSSYKGHEVGHDSQLYTTVSKHDDFDNVVADINVVLTGLDRTVSKSYDFLDNYGEEEVEDTPFEDFLDGERFHVQIDPEEHFSIMAGIASEATLYVPDHVTSCISRGLEKEFSGSGHYPEAKEIAHDTWKFLEVYAEPLPVLEPMGLEEYSSRALQQRHPGRTEDDFIADAARCLEGDTVIATYDADYLDLGLPAAAPKAVENTLKF